MRNISVMNSDQFLLWLPTLWVTKHIIKDVNINLKKDDALDVFSLS
jgi:hypothetical protein